MFNSRTTPAVFYWRLSIILPSLLMAACCLFAAAGCGGGAKEGDGAEGKSGSQSRSVELKILVVDSPQFGDPIARLWSAEDRGTLEITHQTEAEFLRSLESGRPDYEVLIYPPHLLGELVSKDVVGEIAPDVLDSIEYDDADIMPLQRTATSSWGGKRFAFPMGDAQLVLLYRADVFRELGLEPPETWSDYQRAVVTLQSAIEAQAEGEGNSTSLSWPKYSVLEPLESEWAANVLLIRTAGYLKDSARISDLFDYATMNPKVADPPFQKALTDLSNLPEDSLVRSRELQPTDCYEAIMSGETCMTLAIVPGPNANLEANNSQSSIEQVGVQRLPGTRLVYNFSQSRWEDRPDKEPTFVPVIGLQGMLGSTVYFSRKTVSSQQFLLWLSNLENSNKLLAELPKTSLFRMKQRQARKRWFDERLSDSAQEELVTVIEASNKSSLWMAGLRIPEGRQYRLSLSNAVASVIQDENTPEKALQQTASEWDEITAISGRNQQTEAYQASLQLD